MVNVAYRELCETKLSEQQFEKILCPNLRVGVRMGLLNPDDEGWVTTEELLSFLVFIGVKNHSAIQESLVSLGESVTEVQRANQVNITAFKDTFLDHGSSSGILNCPKGFSEYRLNHLKSFSSDGKCMHSVDFARAANDFDEHPANFHSALGSNIQSLELGTFVTIYGRTGKGGASKYLSLPDVDDLWKYNRFPAGWEAPNDSVVGTWGAFKAYLAMMRKRLKTRLGIGV